MTKRYWLFAWSTYYPDGGMNDFIGSYDSIELASKTCYKTFKEELYNNYQLYDSFTHNVIMQRSYDCGGSPNHVNDTLLSERYLNAE